MIRDRGSKKWTSLMIPEHVKMLRDFANDEYYRVEKPVLDEQKMEELNEIVCESMEFRRELFITYYKNGHHVSVQGLIHHLDTIQRKLRIVDQKDDHTMILLDDVVHIEFSN